MADADDVSVLLSYSKDSNTCRQFVIPALDNILKECKEILSQYSSEKKNAEVKLYQRLCILRNVFAFADSCTIQSLLESGLLRLLQAVIEYTSSMEDDGRIRRVVSQLIANATTASEAWCGAVAENMFPKGYFLLMGGSACEGALALSLYNMCMRLGSGFMECLVVDNPKVLANLLLLTDRQAQQGDDSRDEYDELDLLLLHLCLKHDYLEKLMDGIGDEGLKYASALLPRILSGLVARHDQEEEKKEAITASPNAQHAGCRWMFENIVKEIGRVEGRYKNEATSLQIQVMRDSLQIFREIAALQDDGVALTGGISLANEFINAQILETLLVMLESLDQGTTGSSRIVQSHLWTHTEFRRAQLYPGFISDILSVIANACYRRKRVQEHVVELHGIMVILNHLQGNSGSPLAREWALWAVRNLCETSAEARQAIQELQKIDDAPVPADYDVVYEKEHGRLKIGLKQ